MGQHPGGLRFAEQALAEALALMPRLGELIQADAFDGDGASDGGILRAVDNPHRAAPQLADDLVPPDLLHGECAYNFSAAML